MKLRTGLTLAAIAACAANSHAVFFAVNDLGGSSGTGTTNYSTGGLFAGATSGLLKDYATDTNTSVTLSVTTPAGYGSAQWDSGSTNGAMAASGTDAYNLLNGKLNAMGYIWYNDVTTSRTRLTFTGLSPSATYTFALFGNRNRVDYTDRFTITEIVGADSFNNTSSAGTTQSGALTTVLSGANTAPGSLAQYSNISSGVDGTFYVDVYGQVGGTNTHKWYANGLALTEAVPEPATLGSLALAGIALVRRRRHG